MPTSRGIPGSPNAAPFAPDELIGETSTAAAEARRKEAGPARAARAGGIGSPALEAASQAVLQMTSSVADALRAQLAPPFVLAVTPGEAWPAVRGYAAAAAPLVAPAVARTAAAAKAPAPAAGSTRGEWGFLNNAHMSIEDKLFLFMATVQKKNDAVLTQKMKEYKEQFVDKKDDGGFLGIGGAIGKLASGIFGGSLLKDAFEQLGGLVLGAGATALGMPVLAPVLGSVGKNVGRFLGSAVSTAVGGAVSSGSSSSGASQAGGSPDEKLAMLEIQRLVEKQNQMFNCISNVLKSMNDTALNTIGNIR